MHVRWTLGLSDKEIGTIWHNEFRDIDLVFEDRIRQNVATVRMGLRMWELFLRGQGVTINVDQQVIDVDESQKSSMFNEEGRQESDIERQS